MGSHFSFNSCDRAGLSETSWEATVIVVVGRRAEALEANKRDSSRDIQEMEWT